MRVIAVIVGLMLITASTAWFFTDLPLTVHEVLADRGVVELGERSIDAGSSWELIKTVLDVANAVIGCVGIYLTLRANRVTRSTSA